MKGAQIEVMKPKRNTVYLNNKIKEFFGPNLIFDSTTTKQVNFVLNYLYDFDPTKKKLILEFLLPKFLTRCCCHMAKIAIFWNKKKVGTV